MFDELEFDEVRLEGLIFLNIVTEMSLLRLKIIRHEGTNIAGKGAIKQNERHNSFDERRN